MNMNVEHINKLYRDTMDLADRALDARRQDNLTEFKELSRQAYIKESEAANLVAQTDIEPTRSVLHRSAATLAVDCGEMRVAEKLIAMALAGNPPDEIAAELRELLMLVVPQLQQAAGD
jgi:hypothetical protein